ncbi:MAG: hypothetical protein QME35_05245 [Thermoanaerobacteraceae bacterium]|jgi:hypothetical protein|nr:hypothetical protein [Thermoanaerobacteraceae bacterium]
MDERKDKSEKVVDKILVLHEFDDKGKKLEYLIKLIIKQTINL